MFEAVVVMRFKGRTYREACQQRDTFELRCWENGFIPIRGPTLGASIEADVTRLSNGYCFADLAGAKTGTAEMHGHEVATDCQTRINLGLDL